MKINVQIVGMMEKTTGQAVFTHEMPEGATVTDLLVSLRYHPRHIPQIMASVNGVLRAHHLPLADGETVELSILLGGG